MAVAPISLVRAQSAVASLFPKLWLDAGKSFAFQTASGRTASYIQDLSANRNHFRQNNPLKRPLIIPDGQNSKPVLRFDGIDDWMQCISSPDGFKFLNTGQSTIFIVHRPWTVIDPNTLGYVLDNITSSGSVGPRTGFSCRVDDRASSGFNDNAPIVVTCNGTGGGINIASTSISNGVTPPAQWSINLFRIDPGNATASNRLFVSRNGGAELQGNSMAGTISSGGPTYQMALGATGGDSITNYIGDLASIVIFQGSLSQPNISAVLAELNSTWGIY